MMILSQIDWRKLFELKVALRVAALLGLRCQVREKLLAYIQEAFSDALPKTRVELAQILDKKENHPNAA